MIYPRCVVPDVLLKIYVTCLQGVKLMIVIRCLIDELCDVDVLNGDKVMNYCKLCCWNDISDC